MSSEELKYIILRKPVRHFYLKFLNSGELRLTVPEKATEKRIQEVISKKEAWIKDIRQRLEREENQAKEIPDYLPFMGDKYEIVFRPEMKTQIRLEPETLKVYSGVPLDNINYRTQIYKNLTSSHLTPLVNQLAQKHGFQVNKVSIRGQTTFWGTCSRKDGNISLNWKLMNAPRFVIEYMIFHELMHTRYHNHGAQYKKELRQIFPRTNEAELWLKQNNHLLKMY